MRLFKRVLIAMWILPFLVGILVLHGPKAMSQFYRPIAPFLVVFPLFLLIGTVVFMLIRIYQVGMKNSIGPK
jgi:hypothetical protein